jgi:hypothetical protein
MTSYLGACRHVASTDVICSLRLCIYLFRLMFCVSALVRVCSCAVRLYADQWIINLKGCRRKWPLPNFRCYADTCREGLTKPRKTSDQQISGHRFEPGIRCRRLAASICKVERRNMTGLTNGLHFSFFLYGRV